MQTLDFPIRAVGGHTRDTTVDTATVLTIPSGARYCLLQCLAQNIRYTLDGTTPTAAIGFRMTAGNAPLAIWCEAGVTLTVISETAGAEVQFQFYN